LGPTGSGRSRVRLAAAGAAACCPAPRTEACFDGTTAHLSAARRGQAPPPRSGAPSAPGLRAAQAAEVDWRAPSAAPGPASLWRIGCVCQVATEGRMPQIHPCARTTPAVRAEIARSREPTGMLARRFGVSTETIRKWRKRGPKDCLDHSPRPHKLPWRATEEERAIVCIVRRCTRFSLDDLTFALRHFLPHLNRHSIWRILPKACTACRTCRPSTPTSGAGRVRASSASMISASSTSTSSNCPSCMSVAASSASAISTSPSIAARARFISRSRRT
jgi:hypothetical protein